MDRALTQSNGGDPDSSDWTLVSNDADLESSRTSQNIPLSSSPTLTDAGARALLDSMWTFVDSGAELVPHLESDTGPRVDQTATPIWLGGYGDLAQSFICPTIDSPGRNSPALHHSVSPILKAHDVIEGDSDSSGSLASTETWDIIGSSDADEAGGPLESALEYYKRMRQVSMGKRKAVESFLDDDSVTRTARRLRSADWTGEFCFLHLYKTNNLSDDE
ncbi:hypothetical protein B0H13DRAFT_1142365 [Mycena leptocephala]|nr:hypothetical protein B0H13DRAFT_1142365 [Mycena leptocephala]